MKSGPIYLARPTVIELFCRVFQAERAADALTKFNWQAFLDYHNSPTVAAIEQLLARLKRLIGQNMVGLVSARRPPLLRVSDPPSLLYEVGLSLLDLTFRLVGRLIDRLQSRYQFTAREVAFIVHRLETFIHLVDLPAVPERPLLVSLRMDLCDCRWLINYRCPVLKELDEALFVDYFAKTPWLKTIPIANILHPPKKSAA